MKRGFGTNFHNIYSNNADIYHQFSASESFSKDLIKRLEELFKGSVMLDLACGTCHKTDMFSVYFERVIAVDLSEELLSYGMNTYKNNKNIIFILASAHELPLLDNSVDTVFISWGSFPLTKTLREIKRVLRPGGVAIRIGAAGTDEFTKLFPKFDLRRIKNIQNQFKKNGFSTEHHVVNIRFKNLEDAKRILSKVIGVSSKRIEKNNLTHKVVLQYYNN